MPSMTAHFTHARSSARFFVGLLCFTCTTQVFADAKPNVDRTQEIGVKNAEHLVQSFKNRRELFIDDTLLQEVTGLEHRLAIPQPAGTALTMDRPWESRAVAYLSVVSDGRKFQLYYRGGTGAAKNGDLTCYAESVDGINWERPNLGLFEVNGTKANNVVLAAGEPTWATHNFSVMYDTRAGVPADERYKAVGGGAGNERLLKFSGLVRGLYRFTSADGVNWRRLPGTPLFTDYALDSQNVLAWLPEEQCYAIYLRTWTGDRKGVKFAYNSIRTIARSTSKDFITWSEPEPMSFDHGEIENLYTNVTQPYFRAPQILISMPLRFTENRQVLDDATLQGLGIDKTMWLGASDALFMTSRGGSRYQQKFKEAMVRPGTDPSNWAARSNMPGLGVIQTGPAEMSFFVVRGYTSKVGRIERMTLRLDGFASLHAGARTGTALTRPVKLEGNRISLNLSTSARGYIKVIVTDEAGVELPGFGTEDAMELVGDATDISAAWKGSPSLAMLKDKVVRLKFELREADLYAFAVLDE